MRVLESAVIGGARTRDHPVDLGPMGSVALDVTLQHQVYLHLGLAGSCVGVPPPYFCSYQTTWADAARAANINLSRGISPGGRPTARSPPQLKVAVGHARNGT